MSKHGIAVSQLPLLRSTMWDDTDVSPCLWETGAGRGMPELLLLNDNVPPQNQDVFLGSSFCSVFFELL